MAGYTIGSIIRKNRLSRGAADRVAVVFEGQRLTYRELDDRVDRLASGLQRHGFGPGDRAMVLAKNRIEWVEIFFALARLGGVVVPVNYLLKPAELADCLTDSQAQWAFVEAELSDSFRAAGEAASAVQAVVIGGEADGFVQYEAIVADGSAGGVDAAVDLNDLFLLQYTSGTTGFAKAAMHSHAGVLLNMVTQPYDLGIRPDDVYLSVPALCWAAGFHDYCLATWWIGGTVVLNPSRALDPDALCGLIEREKATIVVLVPSIMRLLLASGAIGKHDLSSLRISMTGAEPISLDLLDELSRQLPGCANLQGYGQSEFPIFISVLHADEARIKAGSAGKATSLCELRVVDELGDDTKTGAEGEIVYRSAASMSGYWRQPELTAKATAGGWMHSGDRGFVDADGYLFITGRSKDMIITGGLNVYPAEVERVILDQGPVLEAAVIGVPHPELGEIGRAIIVARDGEPVDLDALHQAVKRVLATYKLPREWVLREDPLPRTASGKIRKFLLKDG
jgi:fatty-acyl-CoA synthase